MLAIMTALTTSQVLADTLPQTTELDRIRVTGDRNNVPAAPTLAIERERLERVPGGTNLVDLRNAGRQGALRDALDHQPGIVVQEFYQPRVNVRGSGIQSNPLNRGITLLQDGLPLNEADGSFVIGMVEQHNTAFVSVRRGANALTPSATTLGGEIDFISMTGVDERGRLRLEGGSYGKLNGQLAWGMSSERGDWRFSASHDENDTYRHHSSGKRQSVHANAGWHAGGSFANRTSLSWTELMFHIPMALPKPRMHQDPRSILGDEDTPLDNLYNVYRRDPLRAARQWRIANRSEWGAEDARHTLGLWWQNTEDLFKNPNVHNGSKTDTTGVQYQFSGQRGQWDYRLGGAYVRSDGMRTYYANNPQTGTRLQRFGDFDTDAASLDVLASLGWQANAHWRLLAENKWSRVRRDAADRLKAGWLNTRHTHSSPRLGAIWQPRQDLRLFANLSRSNEVPSWWEIVSAFADFTNPAIAQSSLLRLRTQTADSVEIGGSGHFGGIEHGVNWQLTLYRSKLDDELMAMVDELGTRTGTFNYAAGTTHQGIEAGLDGRWSVFGGHTLDYRLAWTYSDFTFDGGQFSGNQIAGIPKHLVSTQIMWRSGGLRLGPILRWLPTGTPTDHANTRTIYQDSYTVLGFKLDYTTTDGRWQMFVHADNLTDRIYASSYFITNQGAPIAPIFVPGVGRNATVGLTFRF